MQPTPTSPSPHWLLPSFESTDGSDKHAVGLPLSNVSTPKKAQNLPLSIPSKLSIPSLEGVSIDNCMRLARKRSFFELSLSTEKDDPSKPSKKIKPVESTSLSMSVVGRLDLALNEMKALIKETSKDWVKEYHRVNNLDATTLIAIQDKFESKKNSIYIKFDVPGDKAIKCDRIISEAFHELSHCIKSRNYGLAGLTIRSLNENFIGFAKDSEHIANNYLDLSQT